MSKIKWYIVGVNSSKITPWEIKHQLTKVGGGWGSDYVSVEEIKYFEKKRKQLKRQDKCI